MGPAQGAQGGEGQAGGGLEQAQIFEGLVVIGHRLARHLDLQRHPAFRLAASGDVASGLARWVAGLQHVEVFRPGEGQLVVEAPLHQVHESTGGDRCIIAVHQGD